MNSFTHFGVYGICEQAGKLLVINKGRGPYTGRSDLPGGRLEENEGLADALVREFMEETGLAISVEDNLGTFDFFIRYQEDDFTHMHHIAALFKVAPDIDQSAAEIAIFAEQDSLGALWIELKGITLESATPVAVLAAEWLLTGRLPTGTGYHNDWVVQQLPEKQ
ncbi:hypothetical protein D3C73_1295610 [compost metagenome]